LVDLQVGISHEQNRKLVGATEQVLVEGASKKDPGKLTGRTRTNKLVHFDDTGAGSGTFATVAITTAHPHFLEGTPVGPVSKSEGPSRGLSLPMATASTGCSSCA
jgi:tRNA-2-methylthio-N6-dimethylallyladenosine synthase